MEWERTVERSGGVESTRVEGVEVLRESSSTSGDRRGEFRGRERMEEKEWQRSEEVNEVEKGGKCKTVKVAGRAV